MTEIICPLCGKPNPPDLEVCQFCEAPLKTGGFVASPEDQDFFNQIQTPSTPPAEPSEPGVEPESASSLEEAIPDWLKQTEASFLESSEPAPGDLTPDQVSEEIDSLLNMPSTPPEEGQPTIDDDWLASLLADAGVSTPTQAPPPEEHLGEGAATFKPEEAGEELAGVGGASEEPTPPIELEKPEWLTHLEASSKIKLEGGMQPAEQKEGSQKKGGVEETPEPKGPDQVEVPEWVGKTSFGDNPPMLAEPETPLVPAEIPTWLEALRPPEEEVSPTGPVEDTSTADIVTAGPLVGLRGVISAHPSAIQARKPPTYSIKLRVTDEQRARLEMMEELLAEEQKPKPLPAKPSFTYRHVFRLIIALVLVLPIALMVILRNDQSATPQGGSVPGVVDFSQQVQNIPAGSPVLLAFDYEPGFSGEMNTAISTLLTQLVAKDAYLTLVTTNPAGSAMAESMISKLNAETGTAQAGYSNYTNLGFVPGGTIGLLGLADSPRTIFPRALNGNDVWSLAPLNGVSNITDFSAVIVVTNDSDTARMWIEQVGTILQTQDKPLLMVTSTQAEPLIRPYVEAFPPQVQGLVAGLAGGLAYAQIVGNQSAPDLWGALSIGMTISILIILVGSIISVIFMLLPVRKKRKG